MKSILALALTAALGVVALTPARSEARWNRGYYSTPYYGSYYYPNTSYYYNPGVSYVDPGVSTSYYVAPGTTYVAPAYGSFYYSAPNYYYGHPGYYGNGGWRGGWRR